MRTQQRSREQQWEQHWEWGWEWEWENQAPILVISPRPGNAGRPYLGRA